MKGFSKTTISLAALAIFISFQISNAQIPAKNGGYWYRGNTHTHARFSDDNDKNDVPEIASWYKKAGYNFLLLSEHNNRVSEKKVFCHDEASDPPSFIMICGVEMSKSRHHTAFGIDKYLGDEKSLQDGVNKVIEAGGVPILNHPMDPVMTSAKFIATKGLNHMEIVNGGRLKNTPASEKLWDSVLSAPDGRRVFAVASDDNHYKEANVGRGWIMVNAKNLTKDAIEESIRQGNYYATTGVFLDDFYVKGKTVNIASQNGDTIRFIGRNGSILKMQAGKSGKYKMNDNDLYVRVKITNIDGKAAWTQPHFIK